MPTYSTQPEILPLIQQFQLQEKDLVTASTSIISAASPTTTDFYTVPLGFNFLITSASLSAYAMGAAIEDRWVYLQFRGATEAINPANPLILFVISIGVGIVINNSLSFPTPLKLSEGTIIYLRTRNNQGSVTNITGYLIKK